MRAQATDNLKSVNWTAPLPVLVRVHQPSRVIFFFCVDIRYLPVIA